MMRFTTKNGTPTCEAELKDRLGIYLDNWALIELAKGASERRERFIAALCRGGDLLFSVTNAIEVAGPQGTSADAVRLLLDRVGPHWTPVELDPWRVVERESVGPAHATAIAEWFMDAYCRQRIGDLCSGDSRVVDLSDQFFRLGMVVDRVQGDRDRIRDLSHELAKHVQEYLEKLRAQYEVDPTSLDRSLPLVSFHSRRKARFVLVHLLRKVVEEAKSFRFEHNDVLDFCHAFIAMAYGSLVTLDSHWKRRVESLPHACQLAKVFCGPHLDEFVAVVEACVDELERSHQKARQ